MYGIDVGVNRHSPATPVVQMPTTFWAINAASNDESVPRPATLPAARCSVVSVINPTTCCDTIEASFAWDAVCYQAILFRLGWSHGIGTDTEVGQVVIPLGSVEPDVAGETRSRLRWTALNSTPGTGLGVTPGLGLAVGTGR